MYKTPPRPIVLVGLIILVIALVLGISVLQNSGPLKIKTVTINDTQKKPYKCPRTDTVQGTIKASGSGDVKYYWQIYYPEANKVSRTAETTAKFSGGTKTIEQKYKVTQESAGWTSASPGGGQDQVTLYVTDGKNHKSATAYVIGYCTS